MAEDNGMIEVYPDAVLILTATLDTFAQECQQYAIDPFNEAFHVVASDGLDIGDVASLPADTPFVIVGDVYDRMHRIFLSTRFSNVMRLPDAVNVLNLNVAMRRKRVEDDV